MKRIIIAFPLALLVSLLSGCFFIKADLGLTSKPEPLQEESLAGEGKDKIVLMDITGVITSEEAGHGAGRRKRAGHARRWCGNSSTARGATRTSRPWCSGSTAPAAA